jgi:hypothetical protein
MRVKNSAIQTYKYFSGLEGNQHIASEFALKKIIKIIDHYKIKNILELGLGIGSISYCILDFSKGINTKINYIGTESNEFCLEVLPKYLNDHFDKMQIFDDLNNVISKEKFDLVIIDGKDENLFKIKNMISNSGIIIIEGDRIPQLELVRNSFPNSLFTRLISNYKNPEYGPFLSSDWCGGIQLIFVNPDLYQKINFIYYKITTSIKYRLRAIKN